MENERMTEERAFQIAETADMLREYGYNDEAHFLGRLMENELILSYTPTASMEQRMPNTLYSKREIEDVSRVLVERNGASEDYCAALSDLLAELGKLYRD